MSLDTLPALVDSDLGRPKAELPAIDPNRDYSSAELERWKRWLVAFGAEIGKTDGSTAGSINARLLSVGAVQNNFAASVAPVAGDDSDDGYSVGSLWIIPGSDVYGCVDASVGTAVWVKLNGGGVQNNASASAAPTVNDDSGDGYATFSLWYYPGNGLWICADATVGAATWVSLILTASGSTPSDVGTAAGSSGSSSAYAKGDHVHASPLLARQTVGSEISGGTPLSTTVGVYICDLTGGPFNLELPDPTTVVGYRWLVVDKYGAADATKKVMLLRNAGGDKINGATSDLVLDVAGFAVELFCESPGEWLCQFPSGNVLAAAEAYADAGDAATLASAESYADTQVATKPSLGTGIVAVGSANSGGSGTAAAKDDHVHAHGSQTDESMHAVATKNAGGFVDKDTWDQRLGDEQTWVEVFRDAFGLGIGAWTSSSGGTGAGATALYTTTSPANQPSCRVVCGTTATGHALIRNFSNFLTMSQYARALFETVAQLGAVPSAISPADDYSGRVCLFGITSSGAISGDAAGFRVTSASPNWQATKWISGTPTDIDTGIVADLALHRFKIDYIPGTSITFYLDGAQVAQINSSLPAPANVYGIPVSVLGSAYTSSAARYLQTIFTRLLIKPTTARP